MTNIILNGALGKMGRCVIKTVKQNSANFKIAAGIDPSYAESPNNYDFNITANFPQNAKADVIIDFSTANALSGLLSFAKTNNIPLVLATTGYNKSQIDQIKEYSNLLPIFFTFNMSLGINLVIQLIKKAFKTLGKDFDIEIIEKHHNKKIDAPSGTALMLADAINSEANGYYKYIYNRHDIRKKRDSNEIGIHAVRAGSIVGEHEVIFSSQDETISITHIANSKSVFAAGALKAAEFIKNKSPGLYNMNNLVGE